MGLLRYASLGVLLVTLAAVPEQPRLAGALRDGEVLGASNWQAAQGLLPDEILEHYRRGEYANPVIDLSRPGLVPIANPPQLEQATRANRDRYAVDGRNSLVDVATGEPAVGIRGLPFADIEPNDPQAAAKIVWNNLYAAYYRGDSRFLTQLVMIGRRGIERRIGTEVLMRVYDGSPESAGRDNPNQLVMQSLARVVTPADLNGTISLTWRYRSGDQPDALWTYVPGLRRPRQVNPLNRSDGFLGSDMSLDDGPFFDGKPESFTFRLVGREEMLALVDPFSTRGDADLMALPDGGYRVVWKDVPRIGADDPSWKGLPWAPVSAALARRTMWIVEAVPKDPNYLFGRIVLRIDAENYRGSWATKYDRAGKPLMSYQTSNGPFQSPDGGKTWIPGGGVPVQIAENLVDRRATAIVFPSADRNNPSDFRIATAPEAFDPQVLTQSGK
ncbi:MAG TPA: outer membrane lipoprotein-sorting protein [Candidatus Binatia bacterium]|nr:outer membrane lipoprotein-sorting protein [Candidatus Binatia bacterium]